MVFFIVDELSLLLRCVDCVRFLNSPEATRIYLAPFSAEYHLNMALPLNFSFPHHLFPTETTYMLPEHC